VPRGGFVQSDNMPEVGCMLCGYLKCESVLTSAWPAIVVQLAAL